MAPALLRFPASKSCLAFTRVLTAAYSIGKAINPGAKAVLDKELTVMITPGEWVMKGYDQK